MCVAARRAAELPPVARVAWDAGRRRLTWLALSISLALSMTACAAARIQEPSMAPATSVATVTPGGAATATAGSAGRSGAATEAPTAVATVAAATSVPTPVPSGTIMVHGTTATFTSLRYGYRLTVSVADWLVSETPGTWNGIFQPNAVNPDSGSDWLRDPGVATVEIGVLAVAPGTTVAAWEASEAPSVRMLACKEAASAEAVTVAGAHLLLLPETCPKVVVGESAGDQYFLNAFLVHGTYAVIAQWRSEQGHETADRVAFLQILGTMRWTPA
jgi:hypothetical protein